MDIKELKSIYDYANPIENIGGVSIIAMSEEHKNWLIKQAEMVELLNKKLEWLKRAIEVCNDEKITPKELSALLNIHKE